MLSLWTKPTPRAMTVFKNVASRVVLVLLSADPRCIDVTRQPRCAGRSPVLLWVPGPQEPVASPSGRGQKLTARVRTFDCVCPFLAAALEGSLLSSVSIL